jgi:Ser/Thr protein kinase RdoA (MazF antagonist)
MNEQNTANEHSELLPIIKQYFENPFNYGFNITLIKTGSINETYKIIVNKKPYILQKLSKIFTKDVIEDMIQVTDYLNLNDIKAPHLLETLKGNKYVLENNELYRVYPFLYGETPNKFSLSNNDLKTMGIYLAEVHKALARLDYEPKHKIENFHNTDFYINKIKKIVNEFQEDDKEVINAMISVYDKLNKDFMSENKQIIHSDPRIENILFDKKFDGYAIIDFDTIMKGSKFIDIGDLCRSLFISEDLDELNYSRKMHDKFIIGYYMAMVKDTQKVDRISKEVFMKQCIDATMLLSLELSIRFYIDVIEDNYFGFNKDKFKTRKEHNLVRAQNCYELFRIIHKDNF